MNSPALRPRSAVALVTLALLAASLLLVPHAQASTNGAMIAFGDSVPAGAQCRCVPFPQQYAAMVARHTGRSVRMTNEAVGGATTTSVLSQLRVASVRSAVRASGTVLVMIGANDLAGPFQRVLHHRQRARAAYRPAAALLRHQVAEVIRQLHALHPGIRVLVADYWNVVKDGRVGRQTYGAWGVAKANQATSYANRALYRAARDNGATLVSTYRPFKGARGRLDPTPLLAADGDHPNARGHTVIARAFYDRAPSG